MEIKTHTGRAIQASCGVRINYDKVIMEASAGFVTADGMKAKRSTARRHHFPPPAKALMVVY
jgi:hypothetical protein